MAIELTEQQKLAILKEWNDRPDNPPSLLELIRIAYPNEEFDGRTKEGRAVKKFLATRQIVADGAHVYKPKDKVELTEEHKEYISNNVGMMSAVEIARIVFKDNKITNLNQEARAVSDYISTLDNKVVYQNSTSDVPESNEYKPPKTILRMAQRINKYVHDGLEENNLKQYVIKNNLTKHVKINNFVNNPYPVIKKSDLFILSSKYEGLPNVLLEALVLNKFVISSNCPTGPKEILLNGKGGLLFKVGDHIDLSNKIIYYLKNKYKSKKMLRNSRNNLNKFNYKLNLKKYYNLVKIIL